MLYADPPSPCHARIQQARWSAVQIHNRIKAAPQKTCGGGVLLFGDENFIEIGISVEATGKLRFHQHGDSEVRKLFLQRADRARQQQTVSHGPKPYKEDASFW